VNEKRGRRESKLEEEKEKEGCGATKVGITRADKREMDGVDLLP
jgi:hypothetical protein